MKSITKVMILCLSLITGCKGLDGLNSLTDFTAESAGTNCENGGLKIDSGLDRNLNGVLDANEILDTNYICDGIDGNSNLTKVTNESAGSNCATGGIKIELGVDANDNGVLDEAEISATTYVCNGIDGEMSLLVITNELAGEYCPAGGVKIDSGVDINGNSILDSEEIVQTQFICNGVYDNVVRINIGLPYVGLSFGSFLGWTQLPKAPNLQYFSLDNYSAIDSAILLVTDGKIDINFSATIELYDLTNDKPITNSAIIIDSDIETDSYSQNILDYIPVEELNYGIKISANPPGPDAAVLQWTGMHLHLFRKKE